MAYIPDFSAKRKELSELVRLFRIVAGLRRFADFEDLDSRSAGWCGGDHFLQCHRLPDIR